VTIAVNASQETIVCEALAGKGAQIHLTPHCTGRVR
jgi:hypothetical protein